MRLPRLQSQALRQRPTPAELTGAYCFPRHVPLKQEGRWKKVQQIIFGRLLEPTVSQGIVGFFSRGSTNECSATEEPGYFSASSILS
jgi:hypothetical protein